MKDYKFKKPTDNIIIVRVRILADDMVRLADMEGNLHIITRKEAIRRHYISDKSPKFYVIGKSNALEIEISGKKYLITFRTAGGRRDKSPRICAYIRCNETRRKTTSNLRETLDGQYFQFENYNIHADGYIEELWDESKAEEFEMAEHGL